MNKTLPALRPGAFEIGYTAQDGAQHRVPLAGAAVVRFADATFPRITRSSACYRSDLYHHGCRRAVLTYPSSSPSSRDWVTAWLREEAPSLW